MPKYQHILFDLDHTLWDFEKNATETLNELYVTFKLAELGAFSVEEFCDTFYEVNYELWHRHQTGSYGQVQLREERFPMVFAKLGIAKSAMPLPIGDAYLKLCPSKPHVFPYAHRALNYLKDSYQLHIVTNGFADVQHIKLASANLAQYFDQVVTSDDAGARKPDPIMFAHTLSLIDATPADCVMIGDNLDADILGAQSAGIDCIYFNPKQQPHQAQVRHEISCLSELSRIL